VHSMRGNQDTKAVGRLFPDVATIDDALPERAANYLQQAIDSRHAPDGAAMLTGSAVDAMLKAKGLTKGSLYDRINEAVEKQLLTQDMADWAHEVRLGSNRPRHPDDEDAHVAPE
jgi:hypothetical protein